MSFMMALVAAVLLQSGPVTIEGEKAIDIARSTMLKVKPAGIDLRERFRGFTVADDYEDEKENCTCWLLTPEPCAREYKLSAFAYGGAVHGPVYFDPPAAREPVTGAMEVSPSRDLPPLSWKLAGRLAAALAALALVVTALWVLVRYLVRRVKEHRMSPIERAWVELDRLLKKGLPGRGRYKDFYVELTMVVRRYVQRQHGVVAPHLTTEEFFEVTKNSPSFPKNTLDELIDFLRKADMVKFAGVEATPDTAEGATASARTYMTKDNAIQRKAPKDTNHTK